MLSRSGNTFIKNSSKECGGRDLFDSMGPGDNTYEKNKFADVYIGPP